MSLNSYTKNIFPKVMILSALAINFTTAYAYSNKPDDSLYIDTGVTWHKYQLAKKSKSMTINGSPTFKDDNMGMSLIAGKRFGNLGAELGYTLMSGQQVQISNYTLGGKAKHRFTRDNSNFFFDVNHYIDVARNLELRTALGLGVLLTKTRHSILDEKHKRLAPEDRSSEAELKPRLGAGLQYNFSKEWSATLDMRYQFGNQNYKSMTSTLLNASYRF